MLHSELLTSHSHEPRLQVLLTNKRMVATRSTPEEEVQEAAPVIEQAAPVIEPEDTPAVEDADAPAGHLRHILEGKKNAATTLIFVNSSLASRHVLSTRKTEL